MYLYNNEQFENIPDRIRLTDGMTRTSLHELSVEQQEELGLVYYQIITPEYNTYTHTLSGSKVIDYEAKTFTREIVQRPAEFIKKLLVDSIQKYLDDEAQAHFYDGILSLCSYATSSTEKFGNEGRAGVAWRDACWLTGYAIMADVETGTRSIPTIEQLLSELPAMDWPE